MLKNETLSSNGPLRVDHYGNPPSGIPFDNSYSTNRVATQRVVSNVKTSNTPAGQPRLPRDHSYDVFVSEVSNGYRKMHSTNLVNTLFYEMDSASGYGVYPYTPSPSVPAHPFSKDEVLGIALSRLLDSLRQGNVDVGSSAGEASSGAGEYFDRMGAAKEKASRNVKRGLQKWPVDVSMQAQLIRSFKRGSNGWFLWNYCLKPSMEDLYNALNFTQHPQIFVKKGSKTSTFIKSIIKEDDDPRFEGMYSKLTREVIIGTRLKAAFSIGDNALYNLHRMTTFNPGLIAWNRMPLSFVVDWFANVGGFMDDYETSLALGLNVLWVMQTDFELYSTRVEARGSNSYIRDGYRTEVFQDTTSFDKLVRVNRTIGFTLPTPNALNYFGPGISSPSRGTTAGFLFAQAFGGWKRSHGL
ncbi:maturation protein [ssRNA phage SRR6960797_3]|uniref:Maturation protein n=1 Tax=ssRNA phage SRR6960797_3 TaxID=2786563 RepID=A0A8S5L0Q6_9VIRU|nr:maturation protein [ssRNA phage SRR6960797_3]DAD51043.1 TPA_asm: maturation protein [ssRNA phage SRR6960797_3]